MRAMPFAAAALVVALVGCAALGSQTPAAPTAATAPVPSAPTPTAALTAAPTAPATPEPTSAPDPRADWQQVATPNGTASFRIPPGWTADVGGGELEHDGELHWQNHIEVLDEAGAVQLHYWDGPGADDVAAISRVGIVAEAPVETLDAEELATVVGEVHDPAYLDHAAAAWWIDWGEQGTQAVVSLTTMLGIAANQPGFLTQDGVRGVSFVSLRTMASEADAEAWLAGDEAAELLDIIRTLDLTAAPSPALPSVD